MKNKRIDKETEKCQRCGRCCMECPYVIILDRDTWKKIVLYIERTEGMPNLILWDLDNETQRRIRRSYLITGDEEWDDSDVYELLDSASVPCPFLTYDYKAGAYACEIHEDQVRPDDCAYYHCEGADNDRATFGKIIEQDNCNPCIDVTSHKQAFPDASPEELIPPCEKGLGCDCFITRGRFFHAYAIRHPQDNDVQERAKYFKDILKKNIKTFKKELRSSIELDLDDDDEIEANLEPLTHLLDEINKIIKS